MSNGFKRLIKSQKLQHTEPHFATSHERNSATTPDIVFAKVKAIHNILEDPGPLTTTDHTPIICKITSKPITDHYTYAHTGLAELTGNFSEKALTKI